MARKILIYTGTLIDETTRFSLQELCNICGVHAESVIELVEYGILNPAGKTSRSWKFSSSELNTLKRALRLQRDLEINMPGIAMTLDLLEELELLRRRLDRLEQQYDKWFD